MKSFLAVVIGLITSLVQANEGSAVTKAAQALSLDQLYAVQTLLRAKLDGAWESVEPPICASVFASISAPEVSMLPQLLEAEVQEKIRVMKNRGTLSSYLGEDSRVRSCQSKCRCDFYETAGAGAVKLKFKPLTNQSVLRCARANESWICKSKVLKALTAEAKRAVSENE